MRSPLLHGVENEFRLARDNTTLRPILDSVLLSRCGDSLVAAKLWMEWNPAVDLPYGLIRLAFRSVTRGEHFANAAQIVKQCQERLGEERWVRFARWCLITEEAAVAVGAAEELFERGERRLTVLGDAVMGALHDGGYVPGAERILRELIHHWKDSGVRWLAQRITRADEWLGAHSGWWRVLLGVIDGVNDGPDLLASCVRNIGPFTLPRYPEVREEFARLLKGSRGSQFRAALRQRLKSLDPRTRRGAALVLICSDPRGEADALFLAVRSRAHHGNFDWHEWESFCLTLDFGPSVLFSLKGRLNLLEPQSRALALVILDKGGVDLDVNQRNELMATLATLGNWHLSREPAGLAVLSAESSYDRLIEHLEQPQSEMAQRAAERLLEFHSARLTSSERAMCIAVRHATSSWTWELAESLKKISHDSDFARDLITASNEIAAKGGRAPLLGIAAKAVTEDSGWKDVLWALLCDDGRRGGSSESEGGGMALLEFGFEGETHRQSIGEAAKTCLADPRAKQNRWHEAYHWLALLADEFSGLGKETIREVILHGKPIGYSVTTALIARLGHVPEGFSTERGQRRTTTARPRQSREIRIVVADLKDFGRDSDELHPSLLNTVQESLSIATIEESDLVAIGATGKPGILITTLLRFIYGQAPRLSDTIPLLDVWAKTWHEEQYKPELKRLTRIWKVLRESAILEDKAAAQDYLAGLDRELINGTIWKLAIAWDILELRGALTDEQIPIVFSDYAKHVSFLHDVVYQLLCSWLSSELASNTRSVVVASAEIAVLQLNEAPWQPKAGEHPNPWANLLFPAIIWAHGGNSDESGPVFLRGIRAVFEQIPSSNDPPRTSLISLLAHLSPILAKVSAETLRSILACGTESLEPSVSVFCRLIEAFALKR
jgi:hypothetical protein